MITNLRACHGAIGNAPAKIAVMSSVPVLSQRTFFGNGAPSTTTLLTGGENWVYSGANGPYCAATGGWVVDATISATGSGSGYVVGDTVTVGGGTFSQALQLQVDLVSASGGILDYHCIVVGSYSVYPTAAVTASGGTGSGAEFWLAIQPADFYWDYTNNALYACTTAGDYNVGGSGGGHSVWKQISGGALSIDVYHWTQAYSVGNIVWNDVTQTFGGVSVLAGMYICIAATTGSPTGSMVPQFPLPTSGTVYWRLISFVPQTMGICNASGSQGVYVQASGSFGI